jgi:transposase
MEDVFDCCAGLDVHQKTVWACVRKRQPDGRVSKEINCFGTMTHELRRLAEWLAARGVTHVAMESTGVLWKPVYNILEERIQAVWLCNAKHLKNVPGRKTDAKDCEWIAQLLQAGLLRPSFVPPKAQRELRDLTRTRACLEDDRTRMSNRIHKVLEDANIKLSAVASDVLGVSGRAMLYKLIEGETDGRQLSALAKGRLKSKQAQLAQALTGHVSEHHRFMLRMLLEELRSLEGAIERLNARIGEVMKRADERAAEQAVSATPPEQPAEGQAAGKEPAAKPPLPFLAALSLLVGMWGIKQCNAENVLAEVGTDMRRWPTHPHFASWAGLSPGNNRSAGRSLSAATSKGNNWLRRALTQGAWAAARSKKCYFGARFRRLAKRRGSKRSIVAVSHSMLTALYYMLKNHAEYKDLGPEFYKKDAKHIERAAVRTLERLGLKVTLTPAA